jgi:cytochrome P450 family 710 subfamily A protein
MPGPSFVVPLVGGVVQMVLNPYKFWEDQRKFSFPGEHARCMMLQAFSMQGRSEIFSAQILHPLCLTNASWPIPTCMHAYVYVCIEFGPQIYRPCRSPNSLHAQVTLPM